MDLSLLTKPEVLNFDASVLSLVASVLTVFGTLSPIITDFFKTT